jgi:hypothetical protein
MKDVLVLVPIDSQSQPSVYSHQLYYIIEYSVIAEPPSNGASQENAIDVEVALSSVMPVGAEGTVDF